MWSRDELVSEKRDAEGRDVEEQCWRQAEALIAAVGRVWAGRVVQLLPARTGAAVSSKLPVEVREALRRCEVTEDWHGHEEVSLHGKFTLRFIKYQLAGCDICGRLVA